jgi:hypothetical protein
MFFFPQAPSGHRPPSQLPQFQQYYDQFVKSDIRPIEQNGVIKTWLTQRMVALWNVTLPSGILLLLLPAGMLGLTTRPRRVLAAVLPLFVLAYGCFPQFRNYYALLTAPAVILLVLLGVQWFQIAFPTRRVLLATLLTTTILAVSLTSLAEINPGVRDPNLSYPTMVDVDEKLAGLDFKPAIVLFHFQSGNDDNEEPVYNVDTLNVDDAPVIRAHDLGMRNKELFDYYA